jgi:hypothetical protein
MVTKRSVSLADEVASAVEQAAHQDGVSFSAWLSAAAEKQLRVRQGLRGVAAWEGETGSLSAEELAAGEALLARLRSGVSGVASRVRSGLSQNPPPGSGTGPLSYTNHHKRPGS